ncbi:hypothetical protein BH11PLA2_BH11PLA2_07450 [soil metagenome]
MKRFWKIVPTVGLTAGLSLMAAAQPPGNERGQQPQGARKGPPTFESRIELRSETKYVDHKADPQVEAWVKMLAEKITDAHDEIRDSARTGLAAVGPAALPTLMQLAQGNDGAKATAARKVIEAIEMNQRQRMMMMAASGMGEKPNTPPMATRGRMEERGNTERPNTERPNADRPNTERPNTGRSNSERPNTDKPNAERPGNRPDGARPQPGPDGRPPNPFEALINELKLEERQAKQAHEVMEEFRDKMNGLRKQVEEEKLTREDSQPKREAILKEMMKDMKEILGDKFEKFEEAMKNMPRPGRGPNGEGGDRPRPPKE